MISPLENATLHIESTSGLLLLMHGFITLSDATSYDKITLCDIHGRFIALN